MIQGKGATTDPLPRQSAAAAMQSGTFLPWEAVVVLPRGALPVQPRPGAPPRGPPERQQLPLRCSSSSSSSGLHQ